MDKWNSIWIILIILCVGIFIGFNSCSKKYPVSEFKQRYVQKLNNELSDSNNPVRVHTEKIHSLIGSVTVTKAYVSNLKVDTKDGSDDVGKDGKNIQRITVEITTEWDGLIHKDGRTVFEVAVVNADGNFKEAYKKKTFSDAYINLDDVGFWQSVISLLITVLPLCFG